MAQAAMEAWPVSAEYPPPREVEHPGSLGSASRSPRMIFLCCPAEDENAPAICREVRLREPDAGLVVLMPVPPDSDSVTRILAAGADDCLQLPRSREEFRARMDAWERRLKDSPLDPLAEGSAQSSPIGPAVTLQNITERSRESERHYRILFENNPLPLMIYDLETLRFLAVNKAAVEAYGYAREEFLGMTLKNIKPKADWVALEDNVNQVRNRPTPAIDQAGIWRHCLKDGSIIFVEITSHPLVFEHRKAELVVAYNVTERQRIESELRTSEGRFASFMQNLPGVSFIKNRAGAYVFANSGWEKLFKLSFKASHGKTDDDLFPPEMAKQFRENDALVLRLGKAIQVREQVHDKSGIRHWLVAKFPIAEDDDPAALIGGVGIDVTKEKKAEEALIQHERELEILNKQLEQRVAERTARLEAVNQELESFCYSVSHDLRAPLRGIDGFARALEEVKSIQLDETASGYLGRVRTAAERMGQLIDDLLQLSRISRVELRKDAIDLSELAATIIGELRQNEPERPIEVAIQPGVQVSGDARLLRIMLENLLNNAWKFTSKTEDSKITFDTTPDDDGRSICRIRDNGVGFDMRYANKLFSPFQRLHSMSEFPGTGIGLATVKRIVQLHGGRVWADGVPNQGATISFSLA